jgi:hypothetical protein
MYRSTQGTTGIKKIFLFRPQTFKPQWLLYVPPGLILGKNFMLTDYIYMLSMDLRTNSDDFLMLI